MTSEAVVQRQVWVGLAQRSQAPCTLFRTNSGKAWLSGGGKIHRLPDGTVCVPFGRPVGLGLAMIDGDTVPGLGDLTGYTLVDVTPDMVGRRLPVLTCIETKASSGGRRRQNQVDFIRRLNAVGGIAGFANSLDAANEIVDAWLDGRAPDLV